ncbi:hypothetical protein BGX28_002114, partial [Mortierella sp. GBA30]
MEYTPEPEPEPVPYQSILTPPLPPQPSTSDTNHELELTPAPTSRPSRPIPSRPVLPDHISLRINFRVGEPQTHTRVRASLPEPVVLQYRWAQDTHESLCKNIQRRAAEIPDFEWPPDGQPWLQPTQSGSYMEYQMLDEGSCDRKLELAWQKAMK